MSGSIIHKKKVRYDLYRGHPNMKLLPQTEMKTLMSDILQAEDDSWRGYLNYGANSGDERFRIALQTFLNRRTEDDDMGDITNDGTSSSSSDNIASSTSEHELFITHGVSHGLELLCRTCTEPGDEVWIERPTYFLAPMIFKSNNLIVKSLPIMSEKDSGGDIGQVDIDRLIHMVEEEGIPVPKMIYIIPSYHNPTGRSMTVNERKRLAAFAIEHGVMLVADEVYHLLDWEQKINGEGGLDKITSRPAGIVHFNSIDATKANDNEDRIGCCVSVSSFTKIWCPGVRLGWIDAPSFIIEHLKNYGYIDSQGGVAPFMGSVMNRAIESNLLDTHLDKLKLEYSQRYELMCNILREEPRISILNDKSPISRQGGYFVWIGFPSSVNTDAFVAYSLEKYGLRFMAGKRCDPFLLAKEGDMSGSSIQSCARLCFADLDREDLVNATTTFVESFRSYMKSIE